MGRVVFLFCLLGWVSVVSAQDSLNVRQVSRMDFPMLVFSPVVRGNLLYLGEGGLNERLDEDSVGLWIIDITNPAQPVRRGHVRVARYENLEQLAVVGDYAYLSSGDLDIFNIADPDHPVHVGSYVGDDYYPMGMAIRDTLIYTANWSGGSMLRILNVADPMAPMQIGSGNVNGYAWDVAMVDNYALVTEGSGIHIMDITDWSAPNEVAMFSLPGATSIRIVGHTGYVWARQYLEILDLQNPLEPVSLGHIAVNGSMKLTATQTHVYTSDDGGGMHIVDVTQPSVPIVTGSYVPDNAVTLGVAVSGNLAYMANVQSLYVLDCSAALGAKDRDVPQQPSSYNLSAYPNPFNPTTTLSFSLPKAGHVNLSVYDSAGRLVRTLMDREMEPGDHQMMFEGQSLPSGLYFAKLSGVGAERVQKLLLVK